MGPTRVYGYVTDMFNAGGKAIRGHHASTTHTSDEHNVGNVDEELCRARNERFLSVW